MFKVNENTANSFILLVKDKCQEKMAAPKAAFFYWSLSLNCASCEAMS